VGTAKNPEDSVTCAAIAALKVANSALTFVTYSGAAKAALGADYTLNSIGAVVIGGTSLFGGSGSAIGSIFGAFVMRTVIS
jgi:ribose/xylose/arabinose/galactoside ABC-type transport system permease subunit